MGKDKYTFDPAEVAQTIGLPLNQWEGHCYSIAAQMLEKNLVTGDLMYGDWIGPVAKGTFFHKRRARMPFVHHGWIQLPDGRICDPTRFVFEGKKPYIYVGPNDHYDAGGNAWREANMKPPPVFNVMMNAFDFPKIHVARQYLGTPPYSWDQLFWLANLPLRLLGEDAKRVYQALAKADEQAMVPLDNWRLVMGRK